MDHFVERFTGLGNQMVRFIPQRWFNTNGVIWQPVLSCRAPLFIVNQPDIPAGCGHDCRIPLSTYMGDGMFENSFVIERAFPNIHTIDIDDVDDIGDDESGIMYIDRGQGFELTPNNFGFIYNDKLMYTWGYMVHEAEQIEWEPPMSPAKLAIIKHISYIGFLDISMIVCGENIKYVRGKAEIKNRNYDNGGNLRHYGAFFLLNGAKACISLPNSGLLCKDNSNFEIFDDICTANPKVKSRAESAKILSKCTFDAADGELYVADGIGICIYFGGWIELKNLKWPTPLNTKLATRDAV